MRAVLVLFSLALLGTIRLAHPPDLAPTLGAGSTAKAASVLFDYERQQVLITLRAAPDPILRTVRLPLTAVASTYRNPRYYERLLIAAQAVTGTVVTP